MTERPAPEHGTAQRQLVADYRYTYTGYWTRDAVCRIQIFAAPEQVPVVVATELDENTGTSITNVCEYLAAEVIARHFPERFEAEDPVIWLEHYPRTSAERRQGLPSFSQADFGSFTPRVEYLGTIKRIRIGQPTWRHVDEADVEALVGPLDTLMEDSDWSNVDHQRRAMGDEPR